MATKLLALLLLCAASSAAASGNSAANAPMPAPCYMKSFGSYCWVSYDWNVCNTRSANAFFTYKDCIGAGHLGRSLQCWQVSATERSLPSFKTCADTEVLGRYGANGNNNNNNRWWRPSVWVAPAAPPSPSPPPSRPPPPPPSPSPSPSPSPARPTTSYITFNSFGGMDVAGRDIPNASNGQYYTEMCGRGVAPIKQACAAVKGCRGFTWNGTCGWLKGAVDVRTSRPGWEVYVLKRRNHR